MQYQEGVDRGREGFGDEDKVIETTIIASHLCEEFALQECLG